MTTLLLDTPKKLLNAVAQVIEDHPERWTGEVYARDSGKVPIGPDNPSANSFCAIGMMYRLQYEGSTDCNIKNEAIAMFNGLFALNMAEHNDAKFKRKDNKGMAECLRQAAKGKAA